MNLKANWNLVDISTQKELLFITRTIENNGGEIYLVGGSVRDLVMNKVPKEFDLATSLLPNQIKNLFPKVIATGIKHGTVTILTKSNKYEVTTYRKESSYSDFRRPDKVDFHSSLEEDLKRRDFTINALALNVKTLELIDYHNGLQDISNKIIKAIGDPIHRFQEDGLRPIRAIRFKTTLGFEIEQATYEAIFATRKIIQKIAVERFQDELYKILRSSNSFLGIQELIKNQIFSLFMNVKEINDLSTLQDLKYLDTKSIPLQLAYVWKYFLDTNHFPVSEALKFCSQLKLSREFTKQSLFWLEILSQFESLEFNELSIKQILSKLKTFHSELFLELVKDFLCIVKVRKNPNEFQSIQQKIYEKLQSNIPLTLKELAINGDFIAKHFSNIPKEDYGNLLKICLNEAIEKEINTEGYFLNFIESFYKAGARSKIEGMV